MSFSGVSKDGITPKSKRNLCMFELLDQTISTLLQQNCLVCTISAHVTFVAFGPLQMYI